MPQLAEFLEPFHVQFRRSEGRHNLERYITGLLTEHPNKNCDTIAQVVPGASEQRLQGLLTAIEWDEDDLNRQRIKRMLEIPSEGDAVLVFDDTGFAKKGTASAGVSRQYSGTLGKVGNCQVAVNCHYAERTIAWPVATQLYLPADWTDDPERCRKAGVPEDALSFRTKPEIALALLDEADAVGVPYACVTADADYGDNPNFLKGLESRNKRYVAAVRANFGVVPSRRSQEVVQRVDQLLESLPVSAWRTIRWREGDRDWLRGRFAAIRCWRVGRDGQRRIGWLIGEREARGQSPRRKFYWSNFGPQAPLEQMVEYGHRRWRIEQYHEEAKGELGWDQYQGRLWTGFHRHTVTVMLAYSFLVWQEWEQRQNSGRRGPQRRPFSPSGGPQAHLAAGNPSPHHRVAPPRSDPGIQSHPRTRQTRTHRFVPSNGHLTK